MKNLIKRLPESVRRILTLFLILAGAAAIVRLVVPPALVDHELQVQSSIERELAQPIRYAGSVVCADCHEESKLKREGYHKNLSCETCHGAAAEHAENPTESRPSAPRRREFCSLCHSYDPARPTGFPQINPVAHNPLKQCVTCHNPHDPKPPSVPRECEACHAEIARTKAVSPHVLLECTACHTVPAQHKTSPRAVHASIPTERGFCAKCHAERSPSKDAPKVDFSTHGEKYLCWQCHYPHLPEIE